MRKRPLLDFFKSTKGVITTVVPVVGLLVTLGIVRPFGGETTDALANAAGNTVDAGSSKVTVTTEVRPRSGPRATFTGTGAVDYRTNRGRFTYDYSGTPGSESLNALPPRKRLLGDAELLRQEDRAESRVQPEALPPIQQARAGRAAVEPHCPHAAGQQCADPEGR